MKKYHYWRGFTLALLVLVYVNLFFLSKEVIYRGYIPNDEYNATLEIDVCFRSFISGNYCHNLPAPNEHTPKQEFVCSFEDRIGCYTKGFNQKNVSEIIRKFQSCNLADLVEVKNETKNVTKTSEKLEIFLFRKFVCAKHKFQIHEKDENSQFSISTANKNQPFKVYITYARDYGSGGKYKTKNTHLFERACWVEPNTGAPWNESLKCTEQDKEIVVELEFYSAKYLERPFNTDCIYRYGPKGETQRDCYEICIKEQASYHPLTYKESENVRLVYNKTPELDKIIEDCAESCNQEDCNTMMIQIDDIYEEKREHSDGQIILNLDPKDYRREAIPLVGIAKLLWMITAFASIFFGINFYGMLIKSGNSHSFNNLVTLNKKRKRKNKKFFTMMFAVALLSLSLALIFEKVFFDFGREHNFAHLREASIKDRSVSISLCFDLCKIIKNEFKDRKSPIECTEDQLIATFTIGKLDEMTWNTSHFKKEVAMKNSARRYPIRQDDFPIPRFFRDFKKCFLIFYEAKNYWPHLSLQRYSRIFINMEGSVYYTHFFVEDGHNYPKIESTPMSIPVIHSILLEKYRSRDGCVDYMSSFGKSKDTLIRQCIIEESLKRDKGIPIQVTLLLDDFSEMHLIKKYHDLRLHNDSSLFKSLSKTCKEKFKENECVHISTFLTHQELPGTLGKTSINLAPYIFEKKPFDDEHGLIVSNRVFSFLIIFMGFSIKAFFNALFSPHFLNTFPLRNFQLSRRLIQLALSLLFLLHFCFLSYCIIYHPMIETSSNQHVTDIEPKASIRFCIPFPSINLDSNGWKVKDLNLQTLDFSEIFEKIQIFDDNEKKTTEINMKDFELKNTTMIGLPTVLWISEKNNRTIVARHFYLYILKCYGFFVSSLKNKTERHLNVHYHRLQRLFTISFSLRKLKKHRNPENHPPRFYLFFLEFNSVDFDWPKLLNYGDYDIGFSTTKRGYQDDFWSLKHPISSLTSLLGISTGIGDPFPYLIDLRESFIKEQFATTDLMQLSSADERDFPIKNKQFNYYMQFRAIATKRNEYDFTRNTETINIKNSFYLKKNTSQTDRISFTVSASPFKFQEISRNRFRFVELFLHLFTLISFWFKVDFITLPTSLKKAYPIFKYFVVYFLYFVVDFVIRLFELWFAFVRFLKFKND